MATEVIVRPREGLSVELNGINVISSGERKGSPRDLFWPWCAANIAVLGISYGSFFLGFGVEFAVSDNILLDANLRFVFVNNPQHFQGNSADWMQITFGILFKLSK